MGGKIIITDSTVHERGMEFLYAFPCKKEMKSTENLLQIYKVKGESWSIYFKQGMAAKEELDFVKELSRDKHSLT